MANLAYIGLLEAQSNNGVPDTSLHLTMRCPHRYKVQLNYDTAFRFDTNDREFPRKLGQCDLVFMLWEVNVPVPKD